MRYCTIIVLAVICCTLAMAQAPRQPGKDKSTKDKPKEAPPSLTDKALDKPDEKETPSKETIGGKSRSQWVLDLTSEDASKRTLAILALMNFEDGARAIPHIRARLEDTDLSPRIKACVALRHMTIDDADIQRVIRALVRRLYPSVEKEAIVRYEAAKTLARFAQDIRDEKDIDGLILGMRDSASWEIRHMCVATLWRAAMPDAPSQSNSKEPIEASKAGPNEKAVEAIVDRYLAKTSAVYQERLEMIIGLGAMGQPKDEKLRAKVEFALRAQASASLSEKSPSAPLKLWANAGLIGLAKDEVIVKTSLKRIADFLGKTHDIEVRVQAANVLGALGKKSKPHVTDLYKLITPDTPENLLSAAANALVQILGEGDQKLIDAMVSLMKDNYAKEPARAAIGVTILASMNANKKEVLAELDKIRENKELHIGLRGLIEQAIKHLNEPKKTDKKK